MLLETFCQTVQPPDRPIENGKIEEWEIIEQSIGTKLPGDYKSYINLFGTGCIANFIWVFNPFSKNINLNLLTQIKLQLDAISILKERFGQTCPYPIYPESDGLLPWGITDNGDVVFWLTHNEPDNWEIVLHEARGNEYEEFKTSMTIFLRDLIIGRLNSEIILSELLNHDVKFTNNL